MHAINNYLGGPYASQEACRTAAKAVCARLGQEELEDHLDFHTGWLSIDVINALGASNCGIHLDETATAWDALATYHGTSFF